MAATKTKQSKSNTVNAKGAKKVRTTAPATKLSALDAAAQVLAKSSGPMNCQELIAAMADRKLWTSPGGKTPHNTLYAAILREIGTKGRESRFKKAERGQFIATILKLP